MAGKDDRPNSEALVLGLTGSFGSGCSEVAEILRAEKGYQVVSVSSILKEECECRGQDLPASVEQSRQVLQKLGNELRSGGDTGVLVKRALERARAQGSGTPVVVDSIKNPGEIVELRRQRNSYVIAVDASRDTRWRRIAAKSNYDEKLFRTNDEVDKDEGIAYGQRVQACVDRADIIVVNEEDWRDSERKRDLFRRKVLEHVGLAEKPGTREPRVPELVMQNAYATSLRSRCLSRRVGAVIVLQENPNSPYHVLATGYNHAPFGSYECVEEWGTCYRDKKKSEASLRLKLCPACGRELVSGRCANEDCEYSSMRGDLVDYLTAGRGLDICPAIHAEESALLQTSLLGGPSPRDGIMFTTTFPCALCAKMIVETGIREVVYIEPYPMPESLDILLNAGVELTQFEGVKAQAFVPLFAGNKQADR